jgi:hypothetical protein
MITLQKYQENPLKNSFFQTGDKIAIYKKNVRVYPWALRLYHPTAIL